MAQTPSEPDESGTGPVTLALDEFDRHGTTRARFERRWIEVEHGIPGEIVEAEVGGGRRPRGHITTVLQPAPDRVTPPCVYFRDWACGGCQWQHIEYRGQLARKRAGVESVMAAAGFDLAIDEVHVLDDPWRYRSTAGIALGRRAGFRRQASLAIVPIRDCPISHRLIGRLMDLLNSKLETGDLPDFRGRVRLDVRLAEEDGAEYLQVLLAPDPDRRPREAEIEQLIAVLEGNDAVRSLLLLRPDGEIEAVYGETFGTIEVAGRSVTLSAASFFQTNLRLLPRLIDRLRAEAGPVGGKQVADVYGGVGIFGLMLAGDAGGVTVVESNPWAIEAGRRTAANWGLTNVEFIEAEAENVLPAIVGADVVILDPPRSGLEDTVRDELARQRPDTILYVSCLAQSLARDLLALTDAGYRVHRLELFDFYPQTYHVELLAVLR